MMGGGADGRTNRWTYRQTDGRTDEEKGDVQGQTLLLRWDDAMRIYIQFYGLTVPIVIFAFKGCS